MRNLITALGIAAFVSWAVAEPKQKQIPIPPMDDLLTEDAIMRRLEGGSTAVLDRPFDERFWTEGMGW